MCDIMYIMRNMRPIKWVILGKHQVGHSGRPTCGRTRLIKLWIRTIFLLITEKGRQGLCFVHQRFCFSKRLPHFKICLPEIGTRCENWNLRYGGMFNYLFPHDSRIVSPSAALRFPKIWIPNHFTLRLNCNFTDRMMLSGGPENSRKSSRYVT